MEAQGRQRHPVAFRRCIKREYMKAKRPRGRPKKAGNLPLVFDVLETHERLRLSGLGRNKAINETVSEVRARHRGHAISETTVKNILAKFQPEQLFLFQVGRPGNWKPGVFRIVKEGNVYALKFLEKPPFQKRGRQFSRKKIKFGQNSS